MRWVLLLGIIALATVARAEEEVLGDEEQVDLLDSIDIDNNDRMARALRELLEFNDEDDAEHNEELGIESESRAMDGESALEQKAVVVVEPEDQARYNKFMDTFYRRLNADARQEIDPLDVGIVSKKKKAKSAKNKSAKKGNKADGKNKNKKPKKKGTKKQKKNKNSKNNKKKQNKNKKKGRHPKSLNLNEDEDEDDDEIVEVVAVAEEEVHDIVKRDAELVEDIEEEEDDEEEALERQERSADVVDKDEEGDLNVADSRSGKPKNKNDNKAKKGKAGKRKTPLKRKNGNGKKGKGKGNKKGKKGNKKQGKKSNKSKRSAKKGKSTGPKTSRASVTGIATLTRIGDVSVVERKEGKELRTAFRMGPVNLKVNRRFGSGKNAVVKSASAESPELTGKMHLSVSANGKAKITKFNILRPSVVTVEGSLIKDEKVRDSLKNTNNFMEKSIGRTVPMAAKKLKIVARNVLKETEAKN